MTRRLAVAAACVCIAIALLAARPVATPGPFARDFEAYWSAGAAWNAHADPYGRDVWQHERTVPGVDASRDELLPFVGPPATLLLWGAFARLPYANASALWWCVLALCALALLRTVARAAQVRVDAVAAIALAASAVAFGPLTSDLALGQIAIVALLGACALAADASAFGALAASFQPNVAIGAVAVIGRNRATAALCAGIAAAYLAGALAGGFDWPVRYARVLAEHGASERFSAIQLSPAAIAYGFGALSGAANAIGWAAALAAVAAGVTIALRTRHAFARFAALSTLAPLVAGFFHEHDLVAAFPAAALCALRARGAARSIAALATLFVAIDWLGLAQRPTGIVQSALLAGAWLCAFTALAPDGEERASLGAAVFGAAALAGAAWLGSHYPAPVWPDALGPFRAAAGASAAEVWGAEQRASGLLAANPAWACLRTLSLFGCALLAAATASLRLRGT